MENNLISEEIIIFELVRDLNSGLCYFIISDKSISVKEVHKKINADNMSYEDKMFYNNSINGRNKESIFSKSKEYSIVTKECEEQVSKAIAKMQLKHEIELQKLDAEIKEFKENNEKALQKRDQEMQKRDQEMQKRDQEIQKLKEEIERLKKGPNDDGDILM